MGLITSGPLDGNHPYTILTDIQGLEDHFGDMDFKVAGTEVGVTALQMDIKIKGVTREILHDALKQANVARAQIREVMSKAIAEPRKELSKYAPKFESFQIDKDKIKDVIGTGGKVINDIIEKCNDVKIDIDDNGLVTIYHTDKESIEKAKEMIENIVRVVEIGEVFEGEVTRIEDYGCFIKLFGDKEGLCHVSRLTNSYCKDPRSYVKVGDVLKVVVTDIDDHGKIKVSHKEYDTTTSQGDKNHSQNGRDSRKEYSKKPYNSKPVSDKKQQTKDAKKDTVSHEEELKNDGFKEFKKEEVGSSENKEDDKKGLFSGLFKKK